ncbi:hypothetical protein P0082_05250 [Candidatus Haliotispira prima]|uniref:Uncharacterized protein n=1 Tax=Candidatus Haliotispira prima TaxID=3034016 RepID=A0ABY8MJW6_9SPIO|nr:hypothetical protein P0082_05250 [Candidatus Haliotispira prima]
MASSLQLEISSNVELANIGAVVRLAAEAAPTKAEAQVSKGHVNVSIPAGVTRKISISQHYSSIFSDGVTLADVLTPNTAYKLYLYFPAEIITTTAEITGLNITNDEAAVPFATAALPAAGDAKWMDSNVNQWMNSNIINQCVGSIDTYYFMQEQTGLVVCYYYASFSPIANEIVYQSNEGPFHNIGSYEGSGIATPASNFHFAYRLISGYTSNSANHYAYWIGADKSDKIENKIRSTITSPLGLGTAFDIPVTRH